MSAALTVVAFAVFGVVSVWLTVIDLRERRLPNVVLGWGTAGVVVLLSGAAWCAADGAGWAILRRSLIAACCYGLVFLLLWLIAPGALGAGDVKLSPLIGVIAGWVSVDAAALWVPLAIAACSGIAGLVRLGRTRAQFAFGPVLIVACWLGIGLDLWF